MYQRDDDDIDTEKIVAVGKKPKRKSILGIMFEEIILKNFNEMKNTFVDEVLIPQTMDWLYGLGTDFLSDVFQTSRASSGRRSVSSRRGFIDYGSKSRDIRGRRERRSEREDDVQDYEEISFGTRQDAERVLTKMIATIERYDGTVSVADLLSFSGFKTTYVDRKYGWTKLDRARACRGKDGRYYLDLPDALPIEDD